MERHFDDELAQLKKDLLRMAALVEKAIQESINALTKQDINLAKKIIEQDSKIDELELVIEEHAIGLLALRQPMARDLRFITTGMKINSELERIADLAENIAQRVIELGDEPLLKPLIDIPKLAEVARGMVKSAIDSFVNQDESLAKKVILSDTTADALRNSINEELINDYMIVDSGTVRRAIPLLLVARHLERICDHASYIAADIIYMIKAKIVKHHPERLNNKHK